MTEELLHYLWKFRLYKPGRYSTCNGLPLEIIHPGLHNTDSGPDFFNAKIKIGETLWAGNVEIHHKSSDWERHEHHLNKAYDNVILHVVIQNDGSTKNSSGIEIPVWEMPIEQIHLKNYDTLLKNQNWVPCAHGIDKVNQLEIHSWIERMIVEKLEKKVTAIQQLLHQSQNNWDEVMYIYLVRYFGFGINNQPFEQLARQTPWKTVLKNNDNLLRLEALFLGQAGFLSHLVHEDDYVQRLQKEYQFLVKKYQLVSIPQHQWKFLRLRPSNFPTIRLVQLAKLFHNRNSFFSNTMNAENIAQLIELFNVESSEYWQTHYIPGKQSSFQRKQLGKTSVDLLMINSIIPIMFAYGKLRNDDTLCSRALSFLETIKPESNSITKGWSKLGITVNNALQSQGLVYLKQTYCHLKRCLHCRIGHMVISKTPN